MVIDSVHLAKCAVSIAASAAFLFDIGAGHEVAVLGLIVGGILAAPFGVYFIRRIPARAATVLAGLAALALGITNPVRVCCIEALSACTQRQETHGFRGELICRKQQHAYELGQLLSISIPMSSLRAQLSSSMQQQPRLV